MPPKITIIPVPPARSGDCSKDSSITENHFQVLTALSSQIERIVTGFNDYAEGMSNNIERIFRKLDSIETRIGDYQTIASRVEADIRVAKRDVTHLSTDVVRIDGEIRNITTNVTDRRVNLADKKIDEMKTERRMFLNPIWIVVVAIVFSLIGVGITSNINKIVKTQIEIGIQQAIEQQTTTGKGATKSAKRIQ